MKAFNFTFTKIAIALAGLTVGLSSCLKNDDDYEQPQYAALSVYNASPETEYFDFIANNAYVTGPFKYGQYTSYLYATPGQVNIALYKTGKDAITDTLRTGKITLEADKYHSLFVVDKGPNPNFLLVQDNITTPASGKANVRFVNLISDGGSLVLQTGTDSTVFSGTTYKTATAFSTLSGNKTYDFKVVSGGETKATIEDIEIKSGKVYTIWARGMESSTIDSLKPSLRVSDMFPQ